jgi:hypothetical protein
MLLEPAGREELCVVPEVLGAAAPIRLVERRVAVKVPVSEPKASGPYPR